MTFQEEDFLNRRSVPTSCNPMHYEGDLPGFALHLWKLHGVEAGRQYLDGWCQSQFTAVQELHTAVVSLEAARRELQA